MVSKFVYLTQLAVYKLYWLKLRKNLNIYYIVEKIPPKQKHPPFGHCSISPQLIHTVVSKGRYDTD